MSRFQLLPSNPVYFGPTPLRSRGQYGSLGSTSTDNNNNNNNGSSQISFDTSLQQIAGHQEPEVHYATQFLNPRVFRVLLWLGTFPAKPPMLSIRTGLWVFTQLALMLSFTLQFALTSINFNGESFSFPSWVFTGCTWILCLVIFVNSLQIPKFDFKALLRATYTLAHPEVDKLDLLRPVKLRLTVFMWFVTLLGTTMCLLCFLINLAVAIDLESTEILVVLSVAVSMVWPPLMFFTACALWSFMGLSSVEVELTCQLVRRNFELLKDARGKSGPEFYELVNRFFETHVHTLGFVRVYSQRRKWQVATLGVAGFLFAVASTLVTAHTVRSGLSPTMKATALALTLVGNLIGCMVAIVPVYIYTRLSGEYEEQVTAFHQHTLVTLEDLEWFERVSFYLKSAPLQVWRSCLCFCPFPCEPVTQWRPLVSLWLPRFFISSRKNQRQSSKIFLFFSFSFLQVDLFGIPMTFATFLRVLVPFFISALIVLLEIVGIL